MKNLISLFCFLCGTINLAAQKHEFGVKAGFQRQDISGIGIDSNQERLIFNNYSSVQPHFGLYYKHRLDKFLFLEAAPIFFKETISARYLNPDAYRIFYPSSDIQTTNIYLPIILRVDLGHKISFTVGSCAVLFLNKKKVVDLNVSEDESAVFEDLFLKLNNWPINGEFGLSYEIGKFSINGKYVLRLSLIHI